ncbi:MAG: class I SAM-dependent methyltransferase [Planctomyces sp.]|nr:class I SAM-dependent methyltransferase [Planctomyces sp.]
MSYDFPRYWNLAFQDETQPEADFIEEACRKYCDFPLKRILEPACGGGRQVIEMAQRGYDVTGFDLNAKSVQFASAQLQKRKLSSRAQVLEADMTLFSLPDPFDVAHCFMNSFRHLLTEADAASHLRHVATCLRPGGLYLLGMHLLPPDAEELDCERWTTNFRGIRITTTVRVLTFDRRTREETVRFSLRVRDGNKDLRLRSDHRLRIYRADQIRQLFRRVPEFELVDVYDFWYDLTQPLKLNDELGDTVFVLRRIS